MILRNKTVWLLIMLSMALAFPVGAFAYTYNYVFENVPPAVINWGCPLNYWAGVTSKWNQPRDTGTNPHRGVDVGCSVGTGVYALWSGWLTYLWEDAGIAASLQIDANSNGVKDDPAYYCHYYHLKSKKADGYYAKGKEIGTSGYPSAPHLHFGGVNGNSSPKWYRNETQYRWTSQWNSGRDVDSFSRVSWNSPNTATITAYFKDSGGNYLPAEVRIFHRKAGTSTWTDGGSMTYAGSYVYTFNFTGKYPAGTSINWLVRMKRGGLTVYSYCWAPAKYDQPDPNPNATSYPYPYITSTVQ
jgi:hypothetical protein